VQQTLGVAIITTRRAAASLISETAVANQGNV